MEIIDTIVFGLSSNDVVLKKLKSLNTTKAKGYDNIPPKMITMVADCLSAHVTLLVNRCIREATFPELLKQIAEVTPVFKKDYPTKKSNYRPVSVLPCFSKIFENVIIDKTHEI